MISIVTCGVFNCAVPPGSENICIMVPKVFMAASAAVILAFGIIHMIYTFSGSKLTPRDPVLQQEMKRVSPVISSETTMWKAWIGFNASHSLALLLFGLVYGYLALSKSEVLFRSPFLLAVGFGMLLSLLVLARLYWFSVPFWGACLSFLCYIASIVSCLLQPRAISQ
jgi:hypothetical protein